MKPLLSVSTALVALAMAWSPVMAQQAPMVAKAERTHKMHQTSTTLTLSETAEIKSSPDVAFITFGVQTEAKTAEEALRQNATKMNAVIAAVKQQGIAEKHIQTSGLNLNAVYDYPSSSTGPNTPVLRGYQVSNQVSIRVEEPSRLGNAIDAVVKAGTNQINGISFGLKDPSKAEDQARLNATKTLTARAELYAQSLGLKVKRIVSLSENASYNAPPVMPQYRMVKAEMAADSTPISGGEVSTSVTLNAVFELE
ncbi:SIMPL domain-containing protein [Asticcacaulis tiandongensis]|uniref:SIMPL domain-containing protein n=1 Tax=Asticcacaulis tiandongensis TaxID=2565365 RepID=UPI00112C9D4D|nr:SIMPL domain-containing protein [Asticcacaulis tiandongensis]